MPKQKKSPNYLVLIATILLLGFFGYKYYKTNQLNKIKKEVLPQAIKKVINNDQTKFSVGEIKETNGVYQFELTVNNQKYTSYISKDGKLLFPGGVMLEDKQTKTNATATGTPAKKLTCQDLKKTEKPSLTAFVVANCPYGLQMQRVFKTAINELADLEKFLTIKYMGGVENGKITSMHGDKEAEENLKQICVREEQKDKYWPYLSCYMQEGKTDQCLAQNNIDITKLTSCTSDKNRGLKYAQADFNSANKFNVSSSPTLVLNNQQTVSEFDFGGRTANTVKEILCCGSQNKADFCQKEISKQELAVSFSKTDGAGQGTTQNANCGN